jgi:putative ABC transport system permease protein
MITSMRARLIADPTVRELVGKENTPLSLKWYEKMRSNPQVEFVMPSVRHISLYGDVSVAGQKGRPVEAIYMPTAPGDPLGGGVVFDQIGVGDMPCVVSAPLAEEAGIVVGSLLRLEQSRNEEAKVVKEAFTARVIGVLKARESGQSLVLLPLPVIERIEDFKEGKAVQSLGWNRAVVPPPDIYDGFSLAFGSTLAESQLADIAKSAGRSARIDQMGDAGIEKVSFDGGEAGIDFESVARVLTAVRKNEPRILPHAEASGISRDGISVKMVSDPAGWMDDAGFQALRERKSAGESSDVITIRNRTDLASTLAIPKLVKRHGTFEVPSQLAGVVGAAKRQPIKYDSKSGEFLPLRTGYPGFRLYSRDLEDVAKIRRMLEAEGIPVRTKEDRIDGVLALDAALGKFLLFIISAGALGGLGALSASVYLSVERSQRSYAVLQMIGVGRRYVLVSSLIQSCILVTVGNLLAFVLFHAGSRLLEAVLVTGESSDGQVCYLSPGQWLLIWSASLACAFLATLPAIGKMRSADPARIARGE